MTYNLLSKHDSLQLIEVDGVLYRKLTIVKSGWQKNTTHFLKSNAFTEIQNLGFIPYHYPTQFVDKNGTPFLRVEKIVPFTTPKEWNNEECKQIVKHICKMNCWLLENPNNVMKMLVSDIQLNNATFRNGKPIFVDVGSFTDTISENTICMYMITEAKKYNIHLNGMTFKEQLDSINKL